MPQLRGKEIAMRARHRIVIAVALALSLFSGRFLLGRALRGARHAPPARHAVHPESESNAASADAARRLAESLAQEISTAPADLALAISTARRDCNALADAASRHASVDPETARSSMILGHGLLAGVHLQRADAAWRAGDLERSGREFEAAAEELDSAASWRGVVRATPEDARPLARRLEASDPDVLAQDFEGGEAALSCALWRVAPSAARAAGAAACGTG